MGTFFKTKNVTGLISEVCCVVFQDMLLTVARMDSYSEKTHEKCI